MLKALLRERHLQNYAMFKRAYQKAARGLDKDLVEAYPSRATMCRWMVGQIKDLPHPHHCAVLEAMLPGWTAAELFKPYLPPGEVTGSTLLRELLRRRCLHHYREFCRAYDLAAATIDIKLVGGHPAEQLFHRWLCDETTGLPHPEHCTVLEALFPGYSARQLFAVPEPPEPPEPTSPSAPDTAGREDRPERSGTAGLRVPDEVPARAPVTGLQLPNPGAVPLVRHNGVVTTRRAARTDWDGQVIAMSADRARDFLTRIEATNVGAETVDQLFDDLRRLVIASQQQPLATWLGDLVSAQERAFELLEGRQRPEQTRDLYLVAGLACGLMASASQELGAIHEAMTQARTGYACADNAGHDGLRAWIRGLQAAFTYWDGRPADSLRYAQLGAEVAARSLGTGSVWLTSAEARALAALNRPDEVEAALARAAEARDRVVSDDLDSLGGICTFSRPRQLYFAADALSWGGLSAATHAERVALETLDAYATAPAEERSFGHEAGTRSALAIARVFRGEVDGAAKALGPVLALPTIQRGHGIVMSVERVRTALSTVTDPGRDIVDLVGAIEAFTTERLTLPS
ncbi:MAG: hypothetical protein ACRDRH_25855 [Pseudonocardia sp.]